MDWYPMTLRPTGGPRYMRVLTKGGEIVRRKWTGQTWWNKETRNRVGFRTAELWWAGWQEEGQGEPEGAIPGHQRAAPVDGEEKQVEGDGPQA